MGWPRVRVARARLDCGRVARLKSQRREGFDQILNNVIIATRLISQVKERPPRELDFSSLKKKSIRLVAPFETADEVYVALPVWLRLVSQ